MIGATTLPVSHAATIVFFPEGAYGPTNNCVGIGQVLRERGHRVVFVVEESFAGSLEAQGFEERLMRLGPAPEVEEAPGQFWKDFIRETAPVFRTPTIEQLETFIEPTFRALCDGAAYVDDRLQEIFDELQPSFIVEDNVVCLPCDSRLRAISWARIVSCNPLEIQDPGVPPVFSGVPGRRPLGGGASSAPAYLRALAGLHGEFPAALRRARGASVARGRVHPLFGAPQPLRLSQRRSTTPWSRPLDAVLASPRLLRSQRPTPSFELPDRARGT